MEKFYKGEKLFSPCSAMDVSMVGKVEMPSRTENKIQ